MLGVVVIPSAGRSVAHRVGLSAVEILGNIFLGDFIAARSLSVVFAGNKPALQEIQRSARSDMAYDAVLISTFADAEALARYKVHPEHVKISNYCKKIRESRTFVDFTE